MVDRCVMCGEIIPEGRQICPICEKGEHNMADKMENRCTASLDYEAEYNRLLRERDKMMAENDYLRTELKSMESECYRMRAQLDIVHLIFGGRN